MYSLQALPGSAWISLDQMLLVIVFQMCSQQGSCSDKLCSINNMVAGCFSPVSSLPFESLNL